MQILTLSFCLLASAYSLQGFFDAVVVKMHDFSELVHGAMLHKVVWQSHSCDGWLVAMVAHPFQNGRSHASVSYSSSMVTMCLNFLPTSSRRLLSSGFRNRRS